MGIIYRNSYGQMTSRAKTPWPMVIFVILFTIFIFVGRRYGFITSEMQFPHIIWY